MAKTYRPSRGFKVANSVMRVLLALGIKVGANTLITVRGRSSGRLYSNPITTVEFNGQRYIQSPFGQVQWVRNLRTAGQARLSSGRRSELVAVRELRPEEAGPLFKFMLSDAPKFIADYFAVSPQASVDDFVRDAPNHAAFVVLGPVASGAEPGERVVKQTG
jgi:deazaflavin-dependent oxidoreductase (nitroreductase family)